MNRKVILASHGMLSAGMLDTVTMIAGTLPCPCTAYQLTPGHHPDEFLQSVEEDVRKHPETEFDVVVDLYGASVCNSLYMLTKYENVHLFTGMNLNLVLSLFVEYPDSLKKEDLKRIVDDARAGVRNLCGCESAETDEF
jgi:mannose/fructose-specific phosphotransferase system component IIA